MLNRKQKLVINFVKLKEKFNAIGLLPVKFVERNPPQSLGDIKNSTKFDRTGKITPISLIKLFRKSIFNFLLLKSKLTINKNGINKIEVGLIKILIPKITLPINCQIIFLYRRKINNDVKIKNVINKLI
jgi:hypothetical protein